MWIVNNILRTIFDIFYDALCAIHPFVALFIVSAVFGIIALLVVRYCSNQTAIARVKDEISANILAIKLYKDELRVMFSSLPRVLWGAARLQGHMIPPLLVMLIPMVLIASQMAARHEWRPLHVNENTVVAMELKDGAPDEATNLTPQPVEGLELSRRVRSPATGEVAWNVLARQPGRYALTWDVGGEPITKEIVVGDAFERVSPLRHAGGMLDSFIYPCEAPLPSSSAVQSISVALPPLDSILYGSMWWVVWFLVLSMAVALILKPVLKVKF